MSEHHVGVGEYAPSELHNLPDQRVGGEAWPARSGLQVGSAFDPLEREADEIADVVARSLDGVGHVAMRFTNSGRVRRSAEVDAVGGPVDTAFEKQISATRGHGSPLEPGVRAQMEGAFGADFGAVRVHTGSRASQLNDRIQASAFALGSDVYFRSGIPDQRTADGRRLLAHELAHTVQQGASRVRRARRTPHEQPAPPHVRSAVDPPIRASASRPTLRRHYIPMPGALKEPEILKPKQRWSVVGGDNQILKYSELRAIKERVAAAIPPDSKPSPKQRVDQVRLETVPSRLMPRTYEAVPAKAETTGVIYFNWECPDYFRSDGTVDPLKVKSTVVHEFFHAVSANHRGLQNASGLLKADGGIAHSPMQPDEAVTELLAVRAYEEVFGTTTPYVTGYFVGAQGGVAAAADAAKSEIAKQGKLPAIWTGEMVTVLTRVLGVQESDLVDMYFSDPDRFDRLTADPAKKREIINEWDRAIGAAALQNQQVLMGGYKNQLLFDAITPSVAQQLDEAAGEVEKVRVIQYAARARGAPTDTSPAQVGELTYSDALVKRLLPELLRHAANVPRPAAGGGPRLKISYPREQELVTSNDYAVRTDVSADVDNVRIRIHDDLGWRQARSTPDAWYTDVRVADLPAGPIELRAEAWNPTGARVEQARTFQNKMAASPSDPSPIDVELIRAHLAKLGATRPVKVVAVPKSKKNVGRMGSTAYKLKDAVGTYPSGYTYGLSTAESAMSLGNLVGAPSANDDDPAYAYVHEHFQGAGYESAYDLVVVNADHNASRAMLHELGHFKQDLSGANETNTHVYVLEYHNILLHENLDEGEIRVRYGAQVPPNPSRRTWRDLRTDVASWPATLSLLDEIDQALGTAKYAALADVIRANLVAEHFGDQKGDRARRSGATGAPRVPKYP